MAETKDNVTSAIPVLTPVEEEWVDKVLPLIGEKPTETTDSTPTPTPTVPKGPTPAQVLLAKVANPRPDDLTAPADANGEETNLIEGLYSQLVGNLQSHDGGEDLTIAEGFITDIRKAVAEVPNRIARDIETLRLKLRSAWGQVTLPGGLPEAERLALEETGTKLDSAITGAKDMAGFDGLESGISDWAEKVKQAETDAQRRTEEARLLTDRINKAKPTDAALKDEITKLTEQGQALLIRLEPPLADKTLTDVGKDVGELESAVLALAETVRLRGERAEALKLRLSKIAPDPGLPEDEKALFRTAVTAAVQLIVTPHVPDVLDTVDVRAGELEQEALQQVTTVAERGKRAEALTLRLSKIAPNPGLPEDEKALFRTAVTTAGQLIVTPHVPDVLDKVDTRAGELEQEALQQATTVADRGKRAEALTLRLDGIEAPPRVTKEEGEALSDEVGKARLGLATPHAVLALDGVEERAGELEGQVKTLTETVVKRDQRATAVTDRIKLLTDPPGLNDAEKEALRLAKEAATNALVEPPTDLALGAAEGKAGEAETLHANTIKAIDTRKQKRADLTDLVDKLDIPPQVTPADFRLRTKAQAALKKEIADANTDESLKKAEEGVTAETLLVADLANMLVERGLAENDIAAARKMLTDKKNTADQGFIGGLQAEVMKAAAALPGLADKAAITKLRNGLTTIMAKAGASEAYSTKLREFLVDAKLAETAPGATDPGKIKNAAEAARLAAQAKAKTLDYAGAEDELDKFEAAAGLGAGLLDAAKEWQLTLKAFGATYGAKLDKIRKCKAEEPKPTLFDEIAKVSAVPPVGADLTDAAQKLNDMGKDIDDWAALADAWSRYNTLRTSVVGSTQPVDVAYAAAQVKLTAHNYAGAVADFAGLTGSGDDLKADAKRRHQLLSGRNGGLGTLGLGATKTYIASTHLNPANVKITAANYGGAKTDMDNAEAILDAVAKWQGPGIELRTLKAAHDSANTFGFTNAADAQVALHRFDLALPLVAPAAEKLRQLAEYRVQLVRAEKLRDAQVNASPPHVLCVNAITAANLALSPGKDPAKALDLLKALFEDKTIKAMAADIGLWQQRHAALDKSTTTIAATIVEVTPKAAFQKSLADAVVEATAHRYALALDMLDAHEALIKQAKDYVRARGVAIAAFNGLDRALTEFPTKETEIFGGLGKVEVKKRLDACNVLAGKADFDAATKAYDKFLAECEKMAGNTADLFEEKDGKDCNAGHSLDRHGPGVSDEDLLRRLQTGIAPDNKKSETAASSKFESMTAWLAGREKAIAKMVVDMAPRQMSDISYPIGSVPKLDVSAVIEHDGPIDKAFEGIKPNMEVGSDGTLEEGGTFETFRELKGITKSTSKAVFVIDSPDDDKDKRPPTKEKYIERFAAYWDKKNKEAQKVWDNAPIPKPPPPVPASLAPANLPGKWVLMQHFPLVKGWDQEKGEYVA